jgi:iron complex transport system substrate-binding protein
MPKYTWGGDADAVLPWVREALGDAPLPTLLPDAAVEVPMEEIAAVQPDLILAPYSGITEEDYGRLSQIAPTVAYPEKPWETSWQDQTTIIGSALGRSAQGKALVEQTTSYITGKAAEFPAIAGKTFAYGTISADGAFRLYIPGDPRVQLLEDLGMVTSQFVLDLKVGDGVYFVDISPELIGTLDCQILVMWFDDQSLADAALENPTFAALPMVKSGAYAPIVGQSFVMASSAPTVLSIPWMLDSYVPQLAAAAEKVS